jgi:acetyltransferase-like isoleucine patch superfamily enzyme
MSVTYDVSPGARLIVGDGCRIGDGTRIHARAGVVRIGDGAVIGERCVLICHAGIDIGERARIADAVAIIDFDPVFDDPETPTRRQGVHARPVSIGAGAVVEPGAAVAAGARIPAGAVVPAQRVTR